MEGCKSRIKKYNLKDLLELWVSGEELFFLERAGFVIYLLLCLVMDDDAVNSPHLGEHSSKCQGECYRKQPFPCLNEKKKKRKKTKTKKKTKKDDGGHEEKDDGCRSPCNTDNPP